jgi:hypothetical protein
MFAYLLLAAATVSTGFEGAALGKLEAVSATHWRLGVKGEKDQGGRNRQANWYMFRVDGAQPGVELTFDMADLPGEYNFKPNPGAVTADTPPVISYDQRTWRHLSTFEYDREEPKLRLKVVPERPRFWIAHVPPYTNADLARLRQRIGRNAAFREERIGKTPQGRDLVLWTIGEPHAARTVWLMFRQHSWEGGSSWVGEGAVLELLKDPGLRRGITWKILPMCDPDGVARGGVRFNQFGYDLNRNWDASDAVKTPEIHAQREAIRKWLEAGNKIDLFFSLHNTETSEYLEGPPHREPHAALAERLFGELAKTTFNPSRPLFYGEASTTIGMKGRMDVVQGLSHDFDLPAFLMEQRIAFNSKLGHLPLVEDRLRFGQELVHAFARAIRAGDTPSASGTGSAR